MNSVTTILDKSGAQNKEEIDDIVTWTDDQMRVKMFIINLFSFSNPAVVCLGGRVSLNDSEREDDNKTTTYYLSKLLMHKLVQCCSMVKCFN